MSFHNSHKLIFQCFRTAGTFQLTKPSRSQLKQAVGKRFFSNSNVVKMRFVQYKFKNDGPQRLGAQLSENGDIIEISAVKPSLPNNLVDFLKGGSELLNVAKSVVAEGRSIIRLSEVNILAPLTNPDKVICVGLNYKTHCDEQKKPYPEEPFFFSKFSSTIIGPNEEVKHPPNSRALDWEVELGVVIGKKCRLVSKDEANDYIFGYTVTNDISARDWQTPKKNNGQWLFAKSMDTFCPLGPSVVAKEFIQDPHDLTLTCKVNGIEKQNGNTNDMVHNVYDIVSYLSHCVTLLPGDVILTGTPSGVGVFRQPREFLKVGDVITTEISGLGKLENTVA
ncbi:unnamed protein product [Nezara viridula]|uniref:Fumarylacetoacetase-like C-terminal domain-containing protein n=1 Tax=Nezara viridula TaxID=85310 RepID=A0A9P0HNI9_NEZVI|nr:unnamed protein product [Nezara viridula]